MLDTSQVPECSFAAEYPEMLGLKSHHNGIVDEVVSSDVGFECQPDCLV